MRYNRIEVILVREILLEAPMRAWKAQFREEVEFLRTNLPEGGWEVYHIGSTAIRGIMAKPVVDFLIAVEDFSLLEKNLEKLLEGGLHDRGEAGVPGRRFFLRGTPGGERSAHFHFYQKDHPDVKRHLLFVVYLNARPEKAHEYEQLKLRLSQKYRFDAEKYTIGKSEWIQKTDQEAAKWARTHEEWVKREIETLRG